MAPGLRIGDYEVLRMIAVGGMAELFLARTSGGRVVALKQILPQLEESDEYVQMFADEARLAAALRHPNIAEVFEIGTADGRTFYTMEYLEGRDVRDIQRRASGRGGVPLAHTIAIVNGVCAALHYAHEVKAEDGRPLGIVHRDVTPGNVLVTYSGRVKLLDFGVAKAQGRQTETRAGMIKGKIAYMSPEQCRAQPVDRRSDVFALGILLYELSTGTRMLRAASDFEMLQKISRGEIEPPSRRRADYPPPLEAIVMRALERDPADRYQTAQELQLDLLELVAGMTLDAGTPALEQYMQSLFPPSPDHDQTAARFEQSPEEELFGPPRDLSAPKSVAAQGSGRVGNGPSVIVAEDAAEAPDLTSLVVEIEAESASSVVEIEAESASSVQPRMPTPQPAQAPAPPVRVPAATPMPARVPLPAFIAAPAPVRTRVATPVSVVPVAAAPVPVPAPAPVSVAVRTRVATPIRGVAVRTRVATPLPGVELAAPTPARAAPIARTATTPVRAVPSGASPAPTPARAAPIARTADAPVRAVRAGASPAPISAVPSPPRERLAVATAFAAAALVLVLLALALLYLPSSVRSGAPAALPAATQTTP